MTPPTRAQELAVLRAVTYASLFDYPLTVAQLCESVGVAVDTRTLESWLARGPVLQTAVERRHGLIFPAGRPDLVAVRARREAASRRLLDANRAAVGFITRLPFVRMAAISGSLAHLNADDAADLDLFVITAPGRVWSVTVATLVAAKLCGWRQRLCLNYVISERALQVGPADLFTANQIIHLRPLAGHDAYTAFLDANPFVTACYPNFRARQAPSRPQHVRRVVELALTPLAIVAERLARALYTRHLRRRAWTWQSRDQVRLEPECLKLHTSSHRADVMARFEAAVTAALEQAAEALQPACTGTS